MKIFGKKEPLILLAGDILFFIISLWISLFLRTFGVPSLELFNAHVVPFAVLFIVWVTVFYISGLYGKHTVILRSRLPNILLNAQLVNSAIAVLFFYLVPFFGITPKTVLFIYLAVSFVAILIWRIQGYFLVESRTPENAILIGAGSEMKELFHEVNSNDIYKIRFISSVDLTRTDKKGFWDEIVKRVYEEDVSVIAIDLGNERVEPILPHLYNLIFSKVTFVDMHRMYEDIFDRVPLSLLRYTWFLENISTHPRTAYDAMKRLMDILLSFVLGIVSIVVYPFVYIAIKLDDGGSIFITQERVGQGNRVVRIHKFRSMSRNDEGVYKVDTSKINEV
ncbi:MAG: sugar transferase, partial [Minisyncoccota bacterium]